MRYNLYNSACFCDNRLKTAIYVFLQYEIIVLNVFTRFNINLYRIKEKFIVYVSSRLCIVISVTFSDMIIIFLR